MRDAVNLTIALAGNLPHEVVDKEGDVLAPFTKRREMNPHNVEAIVKILTKRSLRLSAQGRGVRAARAPCLSAGTKLGSKSEEPCQEGSPAHDTSTERTGGTARI